MLVALLLMVSATQSGLRQLAASLAHHQAVLQEKSSQLEAEHTGVLPCQQFPSIVRTPFPSQAELMFPRETSWTRGMMYLPTVLPPYHPPVAGGTGL